MELQELLQDVQSEVDAEAAKANPEARSEDERTEADAETPEGGEDEGQPKADAKPEGEDADKGDDDQDDDSDEDKPRKESRSARLRRQLAALRAENEALKRSPQADAGKPGAAEKGADDPAPKFDDYQGDWDRYDADRIKWAARQAIRDDRAAQERTSAEARQRDYEAALLADFQGAQAQARKAIKDFDEVVGKAADIRVAPHVTTLVLESEKSALLQYHLAQKPALVEELNALSEREAARRIGRLEARLSLPTPKKATSAPRPVDAPKGGAAPSSPEADIDAWLSKTYGKRG